MCLVSHDFSTIKYDAAMQGPVMSATSVTFITHINVRTERAKGADRNGFRWQADPRCRQMRDAPRCLAPLPIAARNLARFKLSRPGLLRQCRDGL